MKQFKTYNVSKFKKLSSIKVIFWHSDINRDFKFFNFKIKVSLKLILKSSSSSKIFKWFNFSTNFGDIFCLFKIIVNDVKVPIKLKVNISFKKSSKLLSFSFSKCSDCFKINLLI